MSEWIDVNDRLPDREGDFYVWREGVRNGYRYVATPHHRIARFVPEDDAGPAMWVVNMEGEIDDVTHWQPLPAPPVTAEERSAALAELLSGKFADDA